MVGAWKGVGQAARGLLRGLHLQNPMIQGKLVGVMCGRALDVAVDAVWAAHISGAMSLWN